MGHGLYSACVNYISLMTHGPYSTFVVHGSWGVQRCTLHGSWDINSPWGMGCTALYSLRVISIHYFCELHLPLYKNQLHHVNFSVLHIGKILVPKTSPNSLFAVSTHLCHLSASLLA